MKTPSINAAAKTKYQQRVLNAAKRKCERTRRLLFETLEDRRLLAGVMVLKLDGATDVVYHGPVEVGGITVPAFSAASVGLGGREREIRSSVRDELNHQFAGLDVAFTLEPPTTGEVSGS